MFKYSFSFLQKPKEIWYNSYLNIWSLCKSKSHFLVLSAKYVCKISLFDPSRITKTNPCKKHRFISNNNNLIQLHIFVTGGDQTFCFCFSSLLTTAPVLRLQTTTRNGRRMKRISAWMIVTRHLSSRMEKRALTRPLTPDVRSKVDVSDIVSTAIEI